LAALQSAFVAHWAHWAVTASQMGRSGGQAVAVRQPTHAPFVVSQVEAPGGHWPSAVQAVWHIAMPGQHAWPTAQSALLRQATHDPRTQKGWLGVQSVSTAHMPQPAPG
jgi:hypothetical protein